MTRIRLSQDPSSPSGIGNRALIAVLSVLREARQHEPERDPVEKAGPTLLSGNAAPRPLWKAKQGDAR
ncbi:hypothetical protein [uncultured Alsobacter sp.]|uniref:hypothetical protein n=1 Tax=uncultured Alsobacter sp. TaxID=1748258 RepID=UPI0025DA651D|nr:hypothetical protein [uncultured Alsobacter sp.]